jgi:hypothetical protein
LWSISSTHCQPHYQHAHTRVHVHAQAADANVAGCSNSLAACDGNPVSIYSLLQSLGLHHDAAHIGAQQVLRSKTGHSSQAGDMRMRGYTARSRSQSACAPARAAGSAEFSKTECSSCIHMKEAVCRSPFQPPHPNQSVKDASTLITLPLAITQALAVPGVIGRGCTAQNAGGWFGWQRGAL